MAGSDRRPGSLAETLALEGGTCPIPFTHDRLDETHHWWHEIANYYHEPVPFRYAFGAWIQAGRSVTFLLKKERRIFTSFDWYDLWVAQAKQIPALAWLKRHRTSLVHQEALLPGSWVELRCVRRKGDPYYEHEDNVSNFYISPFDCTHTLMGSGLPAIEDRHPHEVVRHWEVDDMPGREVLELTTEIFGHLREVVAEAHKQSGARMTQVLGDPEQGAALPLPCMEKLHRFQVARFRTKDGHSVWTNEPPELRAHRRRQELEARALRPEA